MIPLSVLDLVPINEGSTASDALARSVDLARNAERFGYRRFWVAEHHNMPGIASAATSVVIGHLAGGTSTIRIGAGGIMLPNHAPMVIAEQFGTLEALTRGASISAWAARRAATASRSGRCGAIRPALMNSRRTCSSCRRCWRPCSRVKPSRRCRVEG